MKCGRYYPFYIGNSCLTLIRPELFLVFNDPAVIKTRSAEYGVRTADYGVRSADTQKAESQNADTQNADSKKNDWKKNLKDNKQK